MYEIARLNQIVLEDTYSRTNNIKWVKKEIQDSQELMDLIDECASRVLDWLHEDCYKSLKVLKDILLNSDVDLQKLVMNLMSSVIMEQGEKTIQQVVGTGIAYLEGYLQDPFKAAKVSAEIIGIMCEMDLVDVTPAKDGGTLYTMISSQYELPADVVNKIAETKYMPPMLVRPNHVRHNRDSAYISYNESMILGDVHNFHEETISLDVINIQNSIPLELDEKILAIEETSNKPLNTVEKINNFQRMRQASTDVYNLILNNDNQFYNTHAYDMRGRLYSKGYYVHIQGTEYKKCLINFQYKEVIQL